MNMRMVIVAAAGLIAGVGGGTGFKIFTAPPPAEAADLEHATADSTAAHGEEAGGESGDEAHAAATPGGTELLPHAEPRSTADATGDTHAAEQVSSGETTAAAATTTTETADSATSQLGRLLAAMKPEEAARILEPLSDVQVKKLLFALPDRKAAAILAKFKGERAAALARTIVENGGPS